MPVVPEGWELYLPVGTGVAVLGGVKVAVAVAVGVLVGVDVAV